MRTKISMATIFAIVCVFSVVLVGTPVAADSNAVGIVDVTVSPDQPAPNEPVTYLVTIENNAESVYEIDSLRIEHESAFDDPDQVWDVAAVPPGSSVEIPITTVFDEKGLHRTQVVVQGSVNGTSAYRQYPAAVVVREGGPDITLSSTDPVVGSGTNLTVHAVNGENRPVRNINVTARGEDVAFDTATRITAGMDGNTERDFTYRYVPQSAGETDLNVTFAYTTDTGQEQTVTKSLAVDVAEPRTAASVDSRVGPPTIQLTGVEVESEDDHMLITGSASNVGTETVDSVLVRVLRTEAIEPTSPNRDFFIGTVPGSDFGTFDLTAEIGNNVSRIPIEVTYVSNGNRITERTTVEAAETTTSSPDTGSETPLVVYGIGGLVVVAVLGVMGVAIRNSRQD